MSVITQYLKQYADGNENENGDSTNKDEVTSPSKKQKISAATVDKDVIMADSQEDCEKTPCC